MTKSWRTRDRPVMMSSREPVGEMIVFGIGAEIGERQDGNGRLVWKRERDDRRGQWRGGHAEYLYRLSDVLEFLLAVIFKGDRKL